MVTLLGPKILSSKYLRLPSAMNNALTPRLWMKASSLLFFPYVAYTKLSWKGSNYPGRWLMFVGMPVGTLWILSVLFCFCSSAIVFFSRRRGKSGNTGRRGDRFRYKIRFWLLETWFSFLPLLVNLMPDLFNGAVSSAWQYANGKAPRSGQDGDNAAIAYFFHGLYLVVAPVYFCWTGELSLHQNPTNRQKIRFRRMITLAIHCIHRQVFGTAICAIYYMCIITPASIMAGLNVNFMLEGASDEGPNFRIYVVAKWLYQGCMIRIVLEAAKIAWGISRGHISLDDGAPISSGRVDKDGGWISVTTKV